MTQLNVEFFKTILLNRYAVAKLVALEFAVSPSRYLGAVKFFVSFFLK